VFLLVEKLYGGMYRSSDLKDCQKSKTSIKQGHRVSHQIPLVGLEGENSAIVSQTMFGSVNIITELRVHQVMQKKAMITLTCLWGEKW
jgi:hypothetical protein